MGVAVLVASTCLVCLANEQADRELTCSALRKQHVSRAATNLEQFQELIANCPYDLPLFCSIHEHAC